MIRSQKLIIWSFLLSILTLQTLQSYMKCDRQLFPTAINLLRSKIFSLSLTASGAFLFFEICRLLVRILYGELRLIEIEHIQEYGWITVSESFLAITIFRDEFDAKFLSLFSALLALKCIHWILKDRIEYMEQSVDLSRFCVARIGLNITLLWTIDLSSLIFSIHSIIKTGPSVAIYFANEFTLMTISLLSLTIKYMLNLSDIIRGGVWENRSVFLFYFEFVIESLKLLASSFFFYAIIKFYGIPLHLLRDLYLTIRSFIIKAKDIARYRKATANMDQKYPDATEEEINASDGLCIICRDEMIQGKKLSCGHVFHFRCLKSWLERQQACPTCRKSIAENKVVEVAEDNRNEDQQPVANIVPLDGEIMAAPFGDLPVIVIPENLMAPVFENENGNDTVGNASETLDRPMSANPESTASIFYSLSKGQLSKSDSNSSKDLEKLREVRRKLRENLKELTSLQAELSQITEKIIMTDDFLEEE